MRGVMPIGHDPEYRKDENDAEDYRLNALKHRSGKRSHKLTIEEMPEHKHNYGDIYFSESGGTVVTPTKYGSNKSDYDNGGFEMNRTSKETGGDQPHNNMPPYRVVQFIKYVGV